MECLDCALLPCSFFGVLKNENGLRMSIVEIFIQFNKHNILSFVTDLFFLFNLNCLQAIFLIGDIEHIRNSASVPILCQTGLSGNV